MYGDLKILTGTANPQLAMDICDHLGCALTPALCETFSDGELRVEIGASVRGHDVFVIQPTCAPTNRNLMQLCLMLDALKRASAGRITAVIPYYGYARQDRKVSPRAPISAKMVADFLSMAGAQRIVTVDLHAGQPGRGAGNGRTVRPPRRPLPTAQRHRGASRRGPQTAPEAAGRHGRFEGVVSPS